MKNNFEAKIIIYSHKKQIQKFIFYLFIFFLFFFPILSTNTTTNSKSKSDNCGSLCLECIENDANQCSVCRTGIFQFNSRCYNKCPDGTYTDEEWQVCRDCDSDCPICWGSSSDMCGSIKGQRTQVVLLEDEIKKYFLQKKLNQNEIIDWMFKLNIILKKNTKASHLNGINSSSLDLLNLLSPQDVYTSDKIEIDLPIGSFSKNGGVFIPIPSYLTSKSELVHSHWIFVKGMWEGKKWNNEWFPKLPSYIRHKGEKNKIYYESMGYWMYNSSKDWTWANTNKIKDAHVTNEHLIAELNTIKLDNEEFTTMKLQNKLKEKKIELERNIDDVFDILTGTNRLIFAKLKNTVNIEENQIIGTLEDLKQRINSYLNEEGIMNKKINTKNNYPSSQINLRKDSSNINVEK